MLGAMLGDIAGSTYEFRGVKKVPEELWTKKDFVTDDTLLTCATAIAVMRYKMRKCKKAELGDYYKKVISAIVRENQEVSWGSRFLSWVMSGMTYNGNSFGNGAAMKISPVAYVAKDEAEVKELSKLITEVTHGSEKGLYYAEATAMTIFKGLHEGKEAAIATMKKYCPEIEQIESYEKLQEEYKYSELAEETVPAAMYVAMISSSTEDAIKKAIGLGGDADTLAAIAGSIAEAMFKYTSQKKLLEAFRTVARYMEDDSLEYKILVSFMNMIDSKLLIRS